MKIDVPLGPWTPETAKKIAQLLRSLAQPRSYTVATLPSAAENTGLCVFVSDEAGGATMAFSDGTDWRRVQDRAVVS